MARPVVSALLIALVAGCSQPSANGPNPADASESPPVGQGAAQEQEWAAIVRLENQAKAIAKTTGCASVEQCRTAPVGNRACGGPRYYIAYCARTTDSAALFRKLGEVAEAENAYNRRHGLVSTCEFRMPPDLSLSNGECRAATP